MEQKSHQHIHSLWEKLTYELSRIFDTHGVCAAVAHEVAQYSQRTVVVALSEPSNRYYDVWISQPDGRIEQARWRNPEVHINQIVNSGQIVRLAKHKQSASALINSALWNLPTEDLIAIPLPFPQNNAGLVPQGLLAIVDPQEGNSDLEESSLSGVALLITSFLERATLRNLRNRQHIEFMIISEISQSLNSTLVLEEIFSKITDDVRRMLDVESLSIGLLEKHTDEIVFVPELMGTRFINIPPIRLRPNQGIAGWVATHRQPLIVNDAYGDARFFSNSDKASGFVTRSILCVPLQAEDRVIGILEAINKRNGEFTDHDLNLLEAISGPITSAIMNAELHETLDAEKRRMESMFQSMSEGVLTVAPNGRITAVNDALLSLLRLHSGTLVGQMAVETIVLRKHDFGEFLNRVMAHRVDHSTEFPQLACEIKQNGNYIPFLASGTAVVDDEGELTEAIIVFSDLRQIREVERMRDDFFHNIVHELRTPLALILMYARLLLKGAKDDPEKSTRFLETIERESDRLQAMVRQMLQLAKMEAGEIQRSTTEINLNAAFEEMLPPLMDKATEKGLTFIQRIEPSLPLVRADRETIYLIFKNLIENAIKFTLEGAIRVTARDNDGRIEVDISDDGIGIPEQAIPNLFRRFYRAQTAVERGIAGTGLGLYMVKEGVERHKGQLLVQSVAGKGTTFTVKLPGLKTDRTSNQTKHSVIE